jgi:hypothetical protein
MWTVSNLNIYEFKQIPNIQKKVKFVAELGRPISEGLQAFTRNGRLKHRIGAPAPTSRMLACAMSSRTLLLWYMGQAHVRDASFSFFDFILQNIIRS